MNYLKIYNNLVDARKQKYQQTGYYELHHIVPKCLGGTDAKENLVKFTAREHYLAHWLLSKVYPDNYKIWLAFALMSGRLCPSGFREFKSSDYERCKKAQSVATSLRFKQGWNPMAKESSRDKVRQAKLGDKNPMRKNPGNNWSSRPVTVTFKNGETLSYDYGKKASEDLGIPYSTWKWAIKNTNGRIPKHDIESIVQGEPKASNLKIQKEHT